MRIPMLDLAPEVEAHWNEFMQAAQSVLKSTQFVLGSNVQCFEEEVARYLGVKHAVSCNSGTDALVISLRALDIGPADEVITTAFTFFGTAEAISLVGATPVFVDIEPGSFNLDPAQLMARITSKTKAILPVHLFGNPADMVAVRSIAIGRGVAVLEDVAQAMGAEQEGRKVGSLGTIAAFSFFPSKNLGAFGDGGLIATNDAGLAERCRMLRFHGSRNRYFHEMIGYNSRLDELQAAFLRVKLKYLDEKNEGRREVASRYNEVFRGLPGVVTPTGAVGSKHVFHQYTLRVPAEKRDKVCESLAQAGIGSMIYYPIPLYGLPVYKNRGYAKLPETEKACTEVISLPIWPTLGARLQLEIADVVRRVLLHEG